MSDTAWARQYIAEVRQTLNLPIEEFTNIRATAEQISAMVTVEAANIPKLLNMSGDKSICVKIEDADMMPEHKVLTPSEDILSGMDSLYRKIELIKFRCRKTSHYGINLVRGTIQVRFPKSQFDAIWTAIRPKKPQPVPEHHLWWISGISKELDDKKVAEVIP